ncbi:MAG: hypothetical protein JWR57_844 [Mycetocola sp.]|jgi:hypothetical protein|nr:hypothetical protein [Mycetocola sp.]
MEAVVELTNSKRLMYTASHVTTTLTPDQQKELESRPGRGMKKANLMRSLALDVDTLQRVRDRLEADPHQRGADMEKLLAISAQLAGDARRLSHPKLAGALAPIAEAAVAEYAQAVADVSRESEPLQWQLDLYNEQRRVLPVGRLHLERLEMYPAGVEKGELVFSVPMAPGETVTISHKEWSTSTQQFEDIVNDYFESYSERGVAEKTDTSMSADNESKRSSALNFGASVSGTFSGVTLTTTTGIATTKDERQSVRTAMERSREVTEKASARARKEHKVSVKLESTHGIEDSSYRTISNPSSSAMRVDYYKMMRKWRTDLYRYGLRLTYDITVPTPGVRLWAKWQHVRELDDILGRPFVFALKPSDLTVGNWKATADEVGANPAAPPDQELLVGSPDTTITYIPEDQSHIGRYGQMDFEVPGGYRLAAATATANLAVWAGNPVEFRWLNGGSSPDPVPNSGSPTVTGDLANLTGRTGRMSASYFFANISFASLALRLRFELLPSTFTTWQASTWETVRLAALARYHEHLARVQAERDALYRLLIGKDTLTLRRLEREELLRLIVQWLVGPSHPVVTTAMVQSAIVLIEKNESRGLPTFDTVSDAQWNQALGFGEFVKFVQESVEWENLIYFYYPYFWGSNDSASDKMLFEHVDPEHERFLRAGYARVVLTIRPDFERAFTNFVETGSVIPDFVSTYVPISAEIANFAKTNYSGIPPANPERFARPLLYPQQRSTWDSMQTLIDDIEDFKKTSGAYPAALSDLPAPPVDAWGNAFVYVLPGLGSGFDLVSHGANGVEGGEGLDADISSAAGASLVATWFDYTPTSALDIEVDTKPADIA